MKKGQKLKYTGTGFIGFHPAYTEMTFIEMDGRNDLWVYYHGSPSIKGKMLVRISGVEEV
jgi:hypothetical protein